MIFKRICFFRFSEKRKKGKKRERRRERERAGGGLESRRSRAFEVQMEEERSLSSAAGSQEFLSHSSPHARARAGGGGGSSSDPQVELQFEDLEFEDLDGFETYKPTACSDSDSRQAERKEEEEEEEEKQTFVSSSTCSSGGVSFTSNPSSNSNSKTSHQTQQQEQSASLVRRRREEEEEKMMEEEEEEERRDEVSEMTSAGGGGDGGERSVQSPRTKRESISARDLHGFELRKEQVEAYRKFEPLLREEERERITRWVRFSEEYAPQSSSYSDEAVEEEGGGESNTTPSLDMKKLSASVSFVLQSIAGTGAGNDASAGNNAASDADADADEDADRQAKAETLDVATRELRMLVQSGIPLCTRGALWQVFLKTQKQENKSSSHLGGHAWGSLEGYKYLCSDDRFSGGGDAAANDEDPCSGYLKIIDKDIPRTLPAHKQARQFGESGSLRRVLKAYCRHHPEIGYCQGMNFVAGLFLIIIGGDDDILLESNCYWCFDALCSRFLARYYSEDMIELQVDQLVMQQLLEEKFPTVATQMDNLGVSLACVSSSWLLCGFANALPWTTLLRAWDVLLFPDIEEQSSLLFKFTLALVDIHSKSLIQCKEPTQLIVLLQSMAVQSFDCSQLVTIACQGFIDVDKNRLDEYRQMYRPIVTATFGNGKVSNAVDTPEAAKVRDKLGMRSLDDSRTELNQDGVGGDTDRTSVSTASNASQPSSARLLRRRFLGSQSSLGLLSPFNRQQNSVRRSASTSTGILPDTSTRIGDEGVSEQIMHLTSVRYYLEKQVVDLIGIIARMNKDLRVKEELEQQNMKLTQKVESLEKELTQKGKRSSLVFYFQSIYFFSFFSFVYFPIGRVLTLNATHPFAVETLKLKDDLLNQFEQKILEFKSVDTPKKMNLKFKNFQNIFKKKQETKESEDKPSTS